MYVVLVSDVAERAQGVIASFRDMGLNVAVDMTGRKIGQQIRTADKKGIPYIVTIGKTELANEQYALKNLQTGVEESHSAPRIVSIVKDYREKHRQKSQSTAETDDLDIE